MPWPRFSRRSLFAPGFVVHAGHSTKTLAHSWGPTGRDLGMHGLLVLRRGSGWYRDGEGRETAVAAPTLIQVFPGLRHEYGPGPGERWEESFVDFDGVVGDLAERQNLLERRQPVMAPSAAALQPLNLLIAAIADGVLADPLEAQWRLLGILLVMARTRRGGDGNDAGLERGRRALADHPERPYDLRRAAVAAGIGWESFRKKFRERYGMAPGRYRLRLRCEAAAERLLSRDSTVESAATAACFCDGAHLRRHFRAVIGMTPEMFRMAHKS